MFVRNFFIEFIHEVRSAARLPFMKSLYYVIKLYFTANTNTMYTSCHARVFTCLHDSSLRLNRQFSNPIEMTNQANSTVPPFL